jgi:hypothetical protein
MSKDLGAQYISYMHGDTLHAARRMRKGKQLTPREDAMIRAMNRRVFTDGSLSKHAKDAIHMMYNGDNEDVAIKAMATDPDFLAAAHGQDSLLNFLKPITEVHLKEYAAPSGNESVIGIIPDVRQYYVQPNPQGQVTLPLRLDPFGPPTPRIIGIGAAPGERSQVGGGGVNTHGYAVNRHRVHPGKGGQGGGFKPGFAQPPAPPPPKDGGNAGAGLIHDALAATPIANDDPVINQYTSQVDRQRAAIRVKAGKTAGFDKLAQDIQKLPNADKDPNLQQASGVAASIGSDKTKPQKVNQRADPLKIEVDGKQFTVDDIRQLAAQHKPAGKTLKETTATLRKETELAVAKITKEKDAEIARIQKSFKSDKAKEKEVKKVQDAYEDQLIDLHKKHFDGQDKEYKQYANYAEFEDDISKRLKKLKDFADPQHPVNPIMLNEIKNHLKPPKNIISDIELDDDDTPVEERLVRLRESVLARSKEVAETSLQQDNAYYDTVAEQLAQYRHDTGLQQVERMRYLEQQLQEVLNNHGKQGYSEEEVQEAFQTYLTKAEQYHAEEVNKAKAEQASEDAAFFNERLQEHFNEKQTLLHEIEQHKQAYHAQSLQIQALGATSHNFNHVSHGTKAQLEQLTSDYNSNVATLQQQLAEKEELHRQKIDELRQSKTRQHQQANDELNARHEQELSDLHKMYGSKLHRVEERNRQLQQQADQSTDEFSNLLTQSDYEHNQKLQELQAQHEAAIKSLRERHREELIERENLVHQQFAEKIASDHTSAIEKDQLLAQMHDELERLRTNQGNAEASAQQELEVQRSDNVKKVKRELNAKIQALELEKFQAHTTGYNQGQQHAHERNAQLVQDLDQRLANYETRINELSASFESAVREKDEYAAAVEQLQAHAQDLQAQMQHTIHTPHVARELAHVKGVLAATEQALMDKTRELEQAQLQIDVDHGHIQQLKSEYREIHEHRKRLIVEHKDTNQQIKAQQQQLQDELTSLQAARGQVLTELNNTRGQLAEKEQQYNQLRENLKQAYEEDAARVTKEHEERVGTQIKTLQDKIADLEGQIERDDREASLAATQLAEKVVALRKHVKQRDATIKLHEDHIQKMTHALRQVEDATISSPTHEPGDGRHPLHAAKAIFNSVRSLFSRSQQADNEEYLSSIPRALDAAAAEHVASFADDATGAQIVNSYNEKDSSALQEFAETASGDDYQEAAAKVKRKIATRRTESQQLQDSAGPAPESVKRISKPVERLKDDPAFQPKPGVKLTRPQLERRAAETLARQEQEARAAPYLKDLLEKHNSKLQKRREYYAVNKEQIKERRRAALTQHRATHATISNEEILRAAQNNHASIAAIDDTLSNLKEVTSTQTVAPVHELRERLLNIRSQLQAEIDEEELTDDNAEVHDIGDVVEDRDLYEHKAPNLALVPSVDEELLEALSNLKLVTGEQVAERTTLPERYIETENAILDEHERHIESVPDQVPTVREIADLRRDTILKKAVQHGVITNQEYDLERLNRISKRLNRNNQPLSQEEVQKLNLQSKVTAQKIIEKQRLQENQPTVDERFQRDQQQARENAAKIQKEERSKPPKQAVPVFVKPNPEEEKAIRETQIKEIERQKAERERELDERSRIVTTGNRVYRYRNGEFHDITPVVLSPEEAERKREEAKKATEQLLEERAEQHRAKRKATVTETAMGQEVPTVVQTERPHQHNYVTLDDIIAAEQLRNWRIRRRQLVSSPTLVASRTRASRT